MASKEIIDVNELSGEVADFLEKLRLSGEFRVVFDDGVYAIRISSETVSKKGRDFLANRGNTDR